MLGVVLALLAAMSFGLSQILVRRNLECSDPLVISLIVTIIGNILLWPLAIIFTDFNVVNIEGLIFFIIAGFLAPAIARLLYFRGMETAGISANATIFSTYPLYTSIIAVLILGETLEIENWIGLVCIIIGVIFVGRNINTYSKTNLSSWSGLIPPVIASLAISFSQIIRKEGLNTYNHPLLGVAIGYSISMIVYVLILAFTNKSKTRNFSFEDLKMFWKPGVGITIGWLLSFLALSQELVSIIAPVLQTELLFILLFTYIFLRKIEKVSIKLTTSAILIIIGVILISIN